MAVARASVPDLLRPGLLGPQWSEPVKEHHAESEEEEAPKRKRRRRGGSAVGKMATPRLDRRPRKMGGFMGSPPLGSDDDPKMASISAPREEVPRGMVDDNDKGPPYKRGGRLTAAERHDLPKGDFALPGERYPINDENHARNALSRVSQNGSSEEKAKVRAAVHRKYPDIGEE